MKQLLISLLLVVVTASHSLAVDFSERDKQIHAGGCAIVGGISMLAVQRVFPNLSVVKQSIIAVSIPMILGVVKEATDDTFSWEDVGADALGSVIGVSLTFKF